MPPEPPSPAQPREFASPCRQFELLPGSNDRPPNRLNNLGRDESSDATIHQLAKRIPRAGTNPRPAHRHACISLDPEIPWRLFHQGHHVGSQCRNNGALGGTHGRRVLPRYEADVERRPTWLPPSDKLPLHRATMTPRGPHSSSDRCWRLAGEQTPQTSPEGRRRLGALAR